MNSKDCITITALTVYPVKGCAGINLESAYALEQGLGLKLASGHWLHDRQWMIVDAKGRFISQREVPAMAAIEVSLRDNGLRLSATRQNDLDIDYTATLAKQASRDVSVWSFKGKGLDAGPTAMAWLSKVLNRPAALVLFDTDAPRHCKRLGSVAACTFFADGFPYLIANNASVSDLENRMREHHQDAALMLPANRFRPNITISGVAPYEEDLIEQFNFAGATIEMVLKCVRCSVPGVDQKTGIAQAEAPTALLDQYRFDNALGGAVFGVNAILKNPTQGEPLTLSVGETALFSYAF